MRNFWQIEFDLELTYSNKNRKVRSRILYENNNRIDKSVLKGNIIYVIFDGNEILYVGETSTDIRKRLSSGLQKFNSYKKENRAVGGYKGHKFFELCSKNRKSKLLKIKVFPLKSTLKGKKDKLLRESVEGELCWIVRTKTGKWPACQNEIHFHNDNKALTLANKIFNNLIKTKT